MNFRLSFKKVERKLFLNVILLCTFLCHFCHSIITLYHIFPYFLVTYLFMGGGEGRRVPSLLILGGTFPSPCNRFLILQMYCCTKTFWHWAVNFLWPGHCFLTHDFKDSKLLKRIWWQTKHGLWINIFTFDWKINQTKEKVYLIPSYCFSVNLISVKRRLIGSRGVRPLQLFREKQTKKVEKWEVTVHRPVYPFQREATSLIWQALEEEPQASHTNIWALCKYKRRDWLLMIEHKLLIQLHLSNDCSSFLVGCREHTPGTPTSKYY